MSQLDYLWLNFGDKTVKSAIIGQDAILTESATIKLITKYANKNISYSALSLLNIDYTELVMKGNELIPQN